MKTRTLCSLIIAILLMAGLPGAVPPLPAAAGRPALSIDPGFLQYVQGRPEERFAIIVQRTGTAAATSGQDPEEQVVNGQGVIRKHLSMISAFSAEVSGAEIARLAKNPNVRWISPDGPMLSADAPEVSTTWATTIGTAVTTTFVNEENIVDGSGLGPNGTYGRRAGWAKGVFGGFNVEAIPGNAITRVEVVLHGYANSAFSRDLIVKAFLDYTPQPEVRIDTSVFAGMVGAVNAGPVIVDITATRQWQWADFYNDFELYIEQAGFLPTNKFFYDAVGLRITSEPGTDTSLETLPTETVTNSIMDGTTQVNVYNQVIGSTQVWNNGSKPWLQGRQITVAVVDSGIIRTSDLKGRVRMHVNFSPAFHDGNDRYGHGTFVAGIIAGNGKHSSGKYIGVAPKSTLVNVRVADDEGRVLESDVIASLQWIYENKDAHDIRVVNISLNSSIPQSYHTSPLDAAVEILWFNGVVVVVSAGNNGAASLYPPANDPFVITVGATDDHSTPGTEDDAVANFSAYGVTEDGFPKPDLVTPGRLIIGLLPDNDKLTMGVAHPANRVDMTYFKMSGTSVSAPMVSGGVALLLQDEPGLTPDQVKYRLMATANKSWPGYDPARAGAGYLSIPAAVNGTTTESANTGIMASQMLTTGTDPVVWYGTGWNSVGWNTVGWNTVGWNTVGWNTVGWNTVGWNTDYWGE